MNAAEIQQLERALRQGAVYWRPYESAPALKALRIGTDPERTSISYVQEPGPLIFLQGGTFVNLLNCEVTDFITADPLMSDKVRLPAVLLQRIYRQLAADGHDDIMSELQPLMK